MDIVFVCLGLIVVFLIGFGFGRSAGFSDAVALFDAYHENYRKLQEQAKNEDSPESMLFEEEQKDLPFYMRKEDWWKRGYNENN